MPRAARCQRNGASARTSQPPTAAVPAAENNVSSSMRPPNRHCLVLKARHYALNLTVSRTGSGRGRMPRAKKPARSHAEGGRRVRTAGAYHHGDLQRALLEATEELLESKGVEGFTLREVARRAGVSHGAPAHHFGDVRGLLSEFTAQSFAQLSASMREWRARAPDTAFEQLVASGVGYVDYALRHRARFQLMFRSERLDWDRPSLAAAGADAYGQLVECVERLGREAGAPPELNPEKVALAWSIVHGFATLLIDNRNFAEGVSGGSHARALDAVRRLIESARQAFERRV